MKRTTKYVALDVHQASTVASVRDHSGRVSRAALGVGSARRSVRDQAGVWAGDVLGSDELA